MSKFLLILQILFFSLTIISCSSDDGSKSADNTTLLPTQPLLTTQPLGQGF